VRYANISIIEGNDASQHGIGMVAARIAEMALRDERAVIPIGSYQADYGCTLSLPSVVGREGVVGVRRAVRRQCLVGVRPGVGQRRLQRLWPHLGRALCVLVCRRHRPGGLRQGQERQDRQQDPQ